jgi:hypothetical protein
MSSLTPQYGAYPTATPGTLGSSIAMLVTSKQAEILTSLTSRVNGAIALWILRWDGVEKWFPVAPVLPHETIINFPPPANFPAEPTRRVTEPTIGRNRHVIDVESPAYYLIYAPYAVAADIAEVQLNELFPASGSFSAGAQVRGALPQYTNPVAANATGVHAAVAGTAVNTFPGPFGTIESWGRTLQVVFAAAWDGGDIIINGTDQFGQAIEETVVAAAGTTVQTLHAFRTVTGIRKTAVGVAADTASVGIGTGLGVPFSFTLGQEFLAGVAEASTQNTTYYTFIPGTACNGARDYTFIGW